MTAYPRRLIEVDLPIARISAHARREKSIRHGHISTLHIWWARRPLAACRAVICAALWPDPGDLLCPPAFRVAAVAALTAFARRAWPARISDEERLLKRTASPESLARWQALAAGTLSLDPDAPADGPILRLALLDFIADFANWDNSTVPAYLETSRALTQAAHEALGGAPGTRPLVVDPFAGGGSIPLEALRVGADAFASDLNPVAVLLNKVVLEYIPKYGQKLADEVRKWGAWIKEQAEKELAGFYPKDPDGATPIAYLWARTIRCEGSECGITVPLIRTLQISQEGKKWHFAITCSNDALIVDLKSDGKAIQRPTVSGGAATCPRCGYTTDATAVRKQLAYRNGGAYDSRLLAVYVDHRGSRGFRLPNSGDCRAVERAKEMHLTTAFPTDQINPIRPYKNTRGLSAVTRIGITSFCDLYTARQALAITHFGNLVEGLSSSSQVQGPIREAVATTLFCAVSRFVFQNCSVSRWNAARCTIEGAFGKQALQVVWDFAESNPLSNGPANWDGAVDWITKVIESNTPIINCGTAIRSIAQEPTLPGNSAQLFCTDPPYFAAIPYADLSNVFYVWERSFYRRVHPSLDVGSMVNQEDEIIVTEANFGRSGRKKDAAFFESEMVRAFVAARQEIADGGIGVVVFADSNTTSWEAILGAIISAGWSITGSWPLDTERQTRTQATASASLQSSVHIVCRPRPKCLPGDWRDVLAELPQRMHEWMPRLAAEGVVGADAIFACLGPALEIFSRYERVERANGEPVLLKEYLEHVWAAVSKEALSTIFHDADAAGLEPDARLTAMWLWTVAGGKQNQPKDTESAEEESDDDDEAKVTAKVSTAGFALEFDAARKIAQGLGIHLERSPSIVEVKADKARLLPVGERTAYLFGKEEAAGPVAGKRAKKKPRQGSLFETLDEAEEAEGGWQKLKGPPPGTTVLDRLHQAMILFGAQRGELLKRFLVEEGVGKDGRFWKLAQSLAALYPPGTDERRWVEGVLARKKGLGL